MKLTLGFSPCPNDTFIFDALVHNEVDTGGIEFEYLMADVEELNSKAFSGTLDITKVSYHAFLSLTDHYVLLNAGSALGFGVGPLIITSKPMSLGDLKGKTIAIPGKHTTANLLFSLAVPDGVDKKEMVFSEIEQAVLTGRTDAGVIIHENRFTYSQKGLFKVMDLGEYWEKTTGFPIPLGGIAAHRRLPQEVRTIVDRAITESIIKAKNRAQLSDFIKCNAQEMSEDIMQKHIDLYVNAYSENLGTQGRSAVMELFSRAKGSGLISEIPGSIFNE